MVLFDVLYGNDVATDEETLHIVGEIDCHQWNPRPGTYNELQNKCLCTHTS